MQFETSEKSPYTISVRLNSNGQDSVSANIKVQGVEGVWTANAQKTSDDTYTDNTANTYRAYSGQAQAVMADIEVQVKAVWENRNQIEEVYGE